MQDGSEVKSVELERLISQGISLIERRDAFEFVRDHAAELYEAATGSAWRPHTGLMVNHRALTASVQRRTISAARAGDRLGAIGLDVTSSTIPRSSTPPIAALLLNALAWHPKSGNNVRTRRRPNDGRVGDEKRAYPARLPRPASGARTSRGSDRSRSGGDGARRRSHRPGSRPERSR